MLATLGAGALGIGAHCIASLVPGTGEPIVISVFVLIIGKLVNIATLHCHYILIYMFN